MTEEEAYQKLKQFGIERNAVGFGVTKLSTIRTDDFLLPASTLGKLPFAISTALRISAAILATMKDHPNRLYEHHYRQVNFALDRLALALSEYIHQLGYDAIPVPASQTVDWENQRAHLSHKRVAIAAGLGWLGRNNLVVTPDYGAQVRLVTILTDLPLKTDKPLNRDCGKCYRCLEVCPAHAIAERPQDFDHLACFRLLKEFQHKHYVNQYICGLCVRACPGKLSGYNETHAPQKQTD